MPDCPVAVVVTVSIETRTTVVGEVTVCVTVGKSSPVADIVRVTSPVFCGEPVNEVVIPEGVGLDPVGLDPVKGASSGFCG